MTEPTLLIVDDDPGTCETLSDIFQEKGYTVATATTGREAQDKTKQTAFNVALIDIRLPDVDGTALLTEFKKTHPDMVCMIITGYASVQNAINALEDGAEGYFVKPLIIEEIVHRVEETVDKQRLVMEKRRVEEELAKERDYTRHLIESSPDFQITLDKDGRIMDVNGAFEKIVCKGREDLIGASIYEYLPREETEKAIAEIFEHGEVRNIELTFNRPGKETLLCNFSGSVFTIPEEELGIYVTGRDITERKLAEAQIKASLKEKEVLLREIHHRVKNNLQIISSLLSMQARKAKDENVIMSLLDSRSRIQTMSLIHAQLYQSENLEQVEMDTTIRKLVSFMLQLYADAKKNITSLVTAEGVILSISQAIPCGLIINELVSNALKHAFTGMTGGSIEISMRKAGDRIKLTVKDNGVGIPEELDIYKTDTLGLKIVRTLAEEQLKGKMELIRNKGTEIHVQFDKSITNDK